jgi:hypothetical protein
VSVFPATSSKVRLPAYGIYGTLPFRGLRMGAGRSDSGFQPAIALACSLVHRFYETNQLRGDSPDHPTCCSLHGTLSLLAGIDLLTGKVHARVEERHRSREFVSFLKLLDVNSLAIMTP